MATTTVKRWRIHMCDMTHLNARRDSLIWVTWLLGIWDMTHSYVWRDSSIRATWLVHMCNMTSSYVWHDPSILSQIWALCERVMAYIWMNHVIHFNEYVWYDSFIPIQIWCVVRHDSFACPIWMSHVIHFNEYVWHDSFIPIQIWCVVRHDSFACAIWIIHVRDMTHSHRALFHHDNHTYPLTEEIKLKIFASPDRTVFLSTLLSDGDSRLLPWNFVWNLGDSCKNLFESYGDSRENLLKFWYSYLLYVRSPSSMERDGSFRCATELVHMCNMTHSYVRHDSFI